jgi:hypothetical protein
MKITLQTQEYSDDQRRAKWWHSRGYKFTGNPRHCPMANREHCRIHLEEYGRSLDADMNDEWARAIETFEANDKMQTTPESTPQ